MVGQASLVRTSEAVRQAAALPGPLTSQAMATLRATSDMAAAAAAVAAVAGLALQKTRLHGGQNEVAAAAPVAAAAEGAGAVCSNRAPR